MMNETLHTTLVIIHRIDEDGYVLPGNAWHPLAAVSASETDVERAISAYVTQGTIPGSYLAEWEDEYGSSPKRYVFRVVTRERPIVDVETTYHVEVGT